MVGDYFFYSYRGFALLGVLLSSSGIWQRLTRALTINPVPTVATPATSCVAAEAGELPNRYNNNAPTANNPAISPAFNWAPVLLIKPLLFFTTTK
jgi:hypothetical protein